MCAILFYSVLSHCSVPFLREGRRSAYIKPHNPTSKTHRHPIGSRHYTSYRCDDRHCVERRIAVLIVISTTRSAATARQCAHCPAFSSPKAGRKEETGAVVSVSLETPVLPCAARHPLCPHTRAPPFPCPLSTFLQSLSGPCSEHQQPCRTTDFAAQAQSSKTSSWQFCCDLPITKPHADQCCCIGHLPCWCQFHPLAARDNASRRATPARDLLGFDRVSSASNFSVTTVPKVHPSSF